MRDIPNVEVERRIRAENPWWDAPHTIGGGLNELKRRAYIDLFLPLVSQPAVRRAVLLMGPRRVGKTVLIHHAIQSLLAAEVEPRSICYVSVDHPIYNGRGLQELLERSASESSYEIASEGGYVFFDEIQYLKDWEAHLKSLVDAYPGIRFIASGSSAAALRLKSNESGAGRFTDFFLPPVTFYEYLRLLQKDHLVQFDGEVSYATDDVDELNRSFVHYLNVGGYPEAIFSDAIQADQSRFIKSDIIDKVLLRDLPSLYGIQDIQELNYLFTTVAYNTADELSLEKLSQNSGVTKNTLRRYLEYLEAAFLIHIVHRIDRSARRFQRANMFKVYLTNPSIRSALFAPIGEDDPEMGALAETGVVSQWFHDPREIHYARWDGGEVDIVRFDRSGQRPYLATEVKWSDRALDNPAELRNLLSFARQNQILRAIVTTRTASELRSIGDLTIEFVPTALYCYSVGHGVLQQRSPGATAS